MKRLLIAGLAAALIGLTPAAVPDTSSSADAPASHVKGQILVKFRDDRAAAGVLRQHSLGDGRSVGSTGARLISVPVGKEVQLVEALNRNKAVEYAELDEILTAVTEDDYFLRQYALQNTGQSFTNTDGTLTVSGGTDDADVDAVEAWSVPDVGGVKVAILDSGVDNDHDDIAPKVAGSVNFSNASTDEDNYGHGTHVAGIVAATANNTVGVAGVCPDCTILDAKVLNDLGSSSSSSVSDGVNWAVQNGAKVINMSLGGTKKTRTLEIAINNAWKKDVVIVAAAGNNNSTTKFYPAAYPNVIAVAATDNRDAKASFSNHGASWVDVTAPGVNVYSTFPNHPFYLGTKNNRSMNYDVGNGTSMSSPIVAAVAALAWSVNPGASSSTIRNIVESTADKIPGTGSYWAHGRVNAHTAVG